MSKIKYLIRKAYLSLKLYYYGLLDYIDSKLGIDNDITIKDGYSIERKYQNSKLLRGVKQMVNKLRSMTAEERLSMENLLCNDVYVKTRKEKMDELKIRKHVNDNPILKTEDDLVKAVVKNAPRYALEQELKEVRRDIRFVLEAASKDPSNQQHTKDAKALKAKFDRLRMSINRMKQNA